MKKLLRYFFRIAGSLGCLLALAWIGLAIYISSSKQSIIQKARTELKNRVGGDVSVGDMEISFTRHFPTISLHLSKLSLRDSLWQQHRHDLLQADDIDVGLSVFRSLFAGKLRLSTIYIQKGTIYLYTDSSGYSNTSLLQSKKGSDGGPKKEALSPPDLAFADMRLVMEKQDKHKLFDVTFSRLKCGIDEEGRQLIMKIDEDAVIKSFSFNTEKGSFLRNKSLAGKFTLLYNTGSKIVEFKKAGLRIDGHPFVLTGRFFPSVKPDPFLLTVHAERIAYRKATALLTPLIQQKVDLYDVDKPVTLDAVLDAGSADDPTPQISVRMRLEGASVNTPVGRFDSVTAMASFTNEWVRREKRRDENSAIKLIGLHASVQGIPLQSDSAVITNLKKPVMHCDVHSSFPLTKINEAGGSQAILFRKGSCKMDMNFVGPMTPNDSVMVSMNGGLVIDSGAVSYLPYGFTLSDVFGKIRFKDRDMLFDKLEAKTGSSKVVLKGLVKNITQVIDEHANNILMDFSLTSPLLDVEDLTPVLGRPAAAGPRKKSSRPLFGETASRFDELLRDGVIHLTMDAAELRYQHFTGAKARAELLFQGNEVVLKRMELSQESGRLDLSGRVRRQTGSGGNALSFRSHIERVDLSRLFTAFDNFGQESLQDKNLKGKFTADVEMTGRLSEKARMIKNSLKGRVDFSIKDGQLIDFEPMEKIHEKVLKNRDLSEIRFADLRNELELDTGVLNIHRMEITSTAFSLFVEGIYSFDAGPDLSLQVPLSNLKKNTSPDIPPDSKGNDGKAGLSLRLRVRKGDDGKMKISWDPFKKALKKKKASRGTIG